MFMDTDLDGLTSKARIAPEILGRRGSQPVVDATHVRSSIEAGTGLTFFPLADVFSEQQDPILGFGRPNTFLVVPRPADHAKGPGWNKFAAFMLWRKPSVVINTRGRVQSGVLFQLRGLDAETLVRMAEAMERYSGKRSASCAHANAKVLDSVGFTSGGKRLIHIYRPSRLASQIWRHGLQLNGKDVHLRCIRTVGSVSDHFVAVWRREATSMCRSVQKKFQHASGHTPAPLFEAVTTESTPTAARVQHGPKMHVGISRPSGFGAHLGFVFSPHPIFVGDLPAPLTVPELNRPLKPFPGKLNRITKLKKYVLFSKATVWFIRRHLMRSVEYVEGAPVDMLRPSEGTDIATAFRYNFVMTGSQVFLTRLENRNGRDWKKINWLLAKHVLIAGYDPDVRFSGEVWKYADEQGAVTLYMTGDSGTYKPDDAMLEPAVAYVAATFAVPVKGVTTR